jgi:aryl-alcohol dehydrogenase-like predicted oxidoreductase
MEHRLLGRSGLKVPVLSLGTATFGGSGDFFRPFGTTGVAEATRLVDICLEAGVTMFDSADIYSAGLAEEVLGAAVAGRRDEVLISTKATSATGAGPNDAGSSRFHLLRTVDASLRRLRTDRIDLLQLHAFDALTPLEETLRALDDLVRAGKVLYVGCSNYSAWHIMKAIAISDRYGLTRFVAHQAFYSLVCRDFEWDLMPLALDQGVGTVVWSPLGWARLTGKIRRGQPMPTVSRLHEVPGPAIPEEYLYRVVDAIDVVAAQTGKSVPQIAINWLLQRPSVCTVIIGARTESQLRDNLGSVGWSLTPEQVARLDAASELPLQYPHWHQRGFDRNPFPSLR